jgi:hypothetical protein
MENEKEKKEKTTYFRSVQNLQLLDTVKQLLFINQTGKIITELFLFL